MTGVALHRFMDRHHRVFVLTGAGVSTASGIPDYRDEHGAWKRRPPVMILPFLTKPDVYRRYWARAFVGWPRFVSAAPGSAHQALATLERAGRLAQVVTQNVDGLHQCAGSRIVVDLHGRLDVVVCLGCGIRWAPAMATAPDGDADIAYEAASLFTPPRCGGCGGLVKPDVVFFGENVPAPTYAAAREALASADALLAVGTSLMVYSGFRFVAQARDAGLPIAIVNRGHTRADALADLKVDTDAGRALVGLCEAMNLGGHSPQRPNGASSAGTTCSTVSST
jgi:NAD-dependent SIR2 family protein deacetylase